MADVFQSLQKQGINKKVLYPGIDEVPLYKDGTKVFFNYKTSKCDEEKTVLDDSRKHDKPMELIIGKKFKLEVWETCIKTMKSKEVAEFLVERKHSATYPLVSKDLRNIFLKKSQKPVVEQHCCGMMAMADHGTGYPDLDELMKDPQPLIFTLEILRVTAPEDYEKDVWALSEIEKLDKIPKLKEEGNKLYSEKNYQQAAECYGQAIGLLEQLELREKPGDEEFEKLQDLKIPHLLNFSQCKLFEKDYYSVIEHTSTVLKRKPDNVKALYRRAKAHVGAWNPEEARSDFQRVMELDSKLCKSVTKELQEIDELERQKNEEDRDKLKGMFS